MAKIYTIVTGFDLNKGHGSVIDILGYSHAILAKARGEG